MESAEQVTYRFDVPGIVTVVVTTSAGLEGAREAVGALDIIKIGERGQVVGYAGDAPGGTTIRAACVASHDRGYLVEALNADGNPIGTAEPEVCPKPITEKDRSELAEQLAELRATADGDSNDAEILAGSWLADLVERLV